MRTRCLAFALLGLVALAGCQEREVRAYRVPKEDPAAAMPSVAGGSPAAPAGAALAWRAPAHWQEQEATGFRRGSFTLPGPEGTTADLSIIAFPGDAGGLVENLNRWRGQLGLPAGSEQEVAAALRHVDNPHGLHFDVVDYAGTADGRPTRILGAVAEFNGESWFFKLMGPDALVATEADNFAAFLQTVRPPTS